MTAMRATASHAYCISTRPVHHHHHHPQDPILSLFFWISGLTKADPSGRIPSDKVIDSTHVITGGDTRTRSSMDPLPDCSMVALASTKICSVIQDRMSLWLQEWATRWYSNVELILGQRRRPRNFNHRIYNFRSYWKWQWRANIYVVCSILNSGSLFQRAIGFRHQW